MPYLTHAQDSALSQFRESWPISNHTTHKREDLHKAQIHLSKLFIQNLCVLVGVLHYLCPTPVQVLLAHIEEA